jgi:hypothetical protein
LLDVLYRKLTTENTEIHRETQGKITPCLFVPSVVKKNFTTENTEIHRATQRKHLGAPPGPLW